MGSCLPPTHPVLTVADKGIVDLHLMKCPLWWLGRSSVSQQWLACRETCISFVCCSFVVTRLFGFDLSIGGECSSLRSVAVAIFSLSFLNSCACESLFLREYCSFFFFNLGILRCFHFDGWRWGLPLCFLFLFSGNFWEAGNASFSSATFHSEVSRSHICI